MAEKKKYYIDIITFIVENEKDTKEFYGLDLPPKEGYYLTLTINQDIYYLNIENLIEMFNKNGDVYIGSTVEYLKSLNILTEDNYKSIVEQFNDDKFNRFIPYRAVIFEIFEPSLDDVSEIEKITKNQDMINEINALIAGPNGIYIKLLLSTLNDKSVNSKKIFSKAKDLGVIAEEEHKKIGEGKHHPGNISVDLLVGIREIMHSLFTEFNTEGLSENSRSLVEDVLRLKQIFIRYMNTPKKSYHLYKFLRSGCTAARTSWLCETLKYTEANCLISDDIFTQEHIETFKKIIIELLNNNAVPGINIEKDKNLVIFKEEDKYMIGGKYYKKYLKYKAKYLKLKEIL